LNGKSAIHLDGKAGHTGDAGVLTDKMNDGLSVSSAKLPQMTPSGGPAVPGAAGKSTGLSVSATNPEGGRPGAELTGTAPDPTGVRASGPPAKTAGSDHSSGAASHPVKGAAPRTDTVAADSAGGAKTPSSPTSQPIDGGLNENRQTGPKEQPAENASGADHGKASSRLSPASDLNPALNRSGDVQIHNTAGEGPVSRLFQEIRLTGEGVSRLEVEANDESTGKVGKAETTGGDNAQLNSSGQNAEKSPDTAAPVKEAGASQGMSRNQTLDQIVRRAAIHLRNGQQEARIDLKPDFFGQVRMQVISENRQVTVKIVAEHGFVKDMIENNLHQLKADLQQQGLEVDKVEVSVSQDSEEGANNRDKLTQSKSKQGAGKQVNENHAADQDEQKPRQAPGSSDSSATIDYFA
jgi:flagellar hook-length control protein FliK